MSELTEFRWHGRGGQGAKTAALLLADVAFKTGKHVQGFPEYGPERMGAPITAYDRISDTEIRVHSNIYDPDYVVVVDETLLHSVHVTEGLKEDGAILVNTAKTSDEIRPLLGGYKGCVYTIDVKISKIMEEENFIQEMEASLSHKFAKKPEVLEGNMQALRLAMQEVRGDE